MLLIRNMFIEINPRISELNRKFTTFLHVLLRRHESPQATFEKIEKVNGSSFLKKMIFEFAMNRYQCKKRSIGERWCNMV